VLVGGSHGSSFDVGLARRVIERLTGTFVRSPRPVRARILVPISTFVDGRFGDLTPEVVRPCTAYTAVSRSSRPARTAGHSAARME
jgi:hypothetical protein